MKTLLPVAFLIGAVALFFGFVDPRYDSVKILKAKADEYDAALDKANELIKTRDDLLSRYNTFKGSDIERLRKMLPDNIDNVRLLIDMENIAENHGLLLRSPSVSVQSGANPGSGSVGPETNPFGIVSITFSVAASYELMHTFLMDLERSLRLLDVSSISFPARSGDTYEISLVLNTYWLK